jgi:hypothetical protein
MQKPFVNKQDSVAGLRRYRRAGCAIFVAVAALLGTVATAAGGATPVRTGTPTFETAFSAKGEPASLYYKVTFAGREGPHTLQVWRDGQSRLRRRTDDAVDAYVVRDTSDPHEYQMTVVDYQKRITTRIDRDNLIRLGHFSDWFDLAHGLRHPVGQYRLIESAAPAGAAAPVAACRWYELQQGDDGHRICWSDRDRLPLVIWSQQKGVVWRVTEVERRQIATNTFDLHDTGFVRNDANADIDND